MERQSSRARRAIDHRRGGQKCLRRDVAEAWAQDQHLARNPRLLRGGKGILIKFVEISEPTRLVRGSYVVYAAVAEVDARKGLLTGAGLSNSRGALRA